MSEERRKRAYAKAQQIMDRAAADPAFMERVRADPADALRAVGVPEDMIGQFASPEADDAEVAGYAVRVPVGCWDMQSNISDASLKC